MPNHLFAGLARSLAAHGVTHLFGVVGDANAYFVDAYARLDGTHYVTAANENGAVLMAIGAAMLTGGVGFVRRQII